MTRTYENCIKCGSDHIRMHFLRSSPGFEERLRLSCNRCGYDWDELPIDALPLKEIPSRNEKFMHTEYGTMSTPVAPIVK